MTQANTAPLEMWGGVECTVNRVGDTWFDQLAWAGHDRREDDVDRIAALGIRTLRYPVLWERLAPDSLDDIDWTWTDRRLARLRELGIEPIVGLVHHGSGPRYTSLLDPDFPLKLARFARRVAERYPWVTRFTPVNEPLTTARFSGLYGHWYPHGRSDRVYVPALLTQLRGVVEAMRAIREVTPGARLYQTEDCGAARGTRRTRRQVAHERDRRWLTFDFLTGRVGPGHPLLDFLRSNGMSSADEAVFRGAGVSPDLIGLNYYLTSDRFLDDRLERYPREQHGGNGEIAYADVEAVRVHHGGIVGHEAHLVAAWRRYHLPVAITEVHLGCTREEQLRWLVESWEAAGRARARGADVRAVTAWALFGSHNWDSLVTRPDGAYEPGAFDVRGPAPRPTAIARTLESLSAGTRPEHPVLAGHGWWRRPQRLLHPALEGIGERRGPEAAPILIIGATGTLGRAFHRICEQRGLCSRLVGRQDVDITDPRRVDAVLRRFEPWAVVNAAGYVRVDAAESDRDGCHRVNVTGALNVAAACRRRGVPLVTFSSDLVFDGEAGRPYVEADPVRPLNVYGETKAAVERGVLELLPSALVIRTSAFFGPWDAHNFVTRLLQQLDDGEMCDAACDTVVSPTYVPDLVHAALDLLIDGEQGVWHLANRGALSWYDFACEAARRTGRDVDGVRPMPTADVWKPAARPRYSALASSRGQLLRTVEAALDAYVDETPHARRATGAGACGLR